MGGGQALGRVDVFRKLSIVVVLVFALIQLHTFATPTAGLDPRGLLALGFVILAAYTVGELAEVIRLPHITGYLIAGLILGPSTAHILHDALPNLHLPAPFDEGVLNEEVKHQLLLLDDLALALIALTAGGELKIEQLRDGIRRITAISAAQVVIVGGIVTAFVWLISGPLPALALPQLAGVGTMGALALGAVVGAISLATSPAATIAVINSTGAKGETTSTVLSVVVAKDVLVVIAFSAATALATSALGIGGGEGGFWLSMEHIGLSIVFGVVLGVLIQAYLRFLGWNFWLFLVFLIFAATYLADLWHAEAALVFIAAGFVSSNFGDQGEHLIHEVERLSLPVYVVFFTLAGAKLHLDVLWSMAGFAVALVMVRMAALYVSTRLGAVVSGGKEPLQRYGWMGFVSQAGLAITLATQVGTTYPGEIGEGLFSLLLGGVALNEMFGPVMLQWGLGFAGETADREEKPGEGNVVAPALIDEVAGDDPFGPVLQTGVATLDEVVLDLDRQLRTLVEDFKAGHLTRSREEFEAYVGDLRRDFLRGHRRALRAAQSAGEGDDLPRLLLDEVAQLGSAWRDRVLARAALARSESWSPGEMVTVLDALVAELPESVRAPVDPASLAKRDEGALRRVRRRLLRQRVRWLGMQREIDLRGLGRYHLAGRAPSRLEGVAALVINEEGHMAARTSALFAGIARSWKKAAELARSQSTSGEALAERLAGMRVDVDGDFDAILQEIRGAYDEGARRTSLVVGHLVRDLKDDVRRIGTLDLPHRMRRYSRVYAERNSGLRALTMDLAGARRTVSARMAAVALDLELVSLEGRIQNVVDHHADRIERAIRGRAPLQLDRVDQALGDWLEAVSAVLADGEQSAGDLLGFVKEHAESLERVVHGALRAAQQARSELSGDEATSGLLRSLMDEAQGLTDWYTVPSTRIPDGDWKLPPEITRVELPFRELTVAWFESNIALELGNRTWTLADRLGELILVLTEIDRVIVFNVELASSELGIVARDEAVPAETHALVSEMLVGAVGRSRNRLQRMSSDVESWPGQGREAVRSAVIDGVEELRLQLIDGGLSDLRSRLFGDRGVRVGRFSARDLGSVARGASRQVTQMALQALGEDRVESLRQGLGLPRHLVADSDLRGALAPPRPLVALPAVYRRLFSDRALEAGDLTVGRESELSTAQAALAPGRRLRSVALVGTRGSGATSMAAAVARGWGGRIRRIELDEPVSVAQVEQWFSEGAPDTLTVLTGLRWLFEMRPGGFDALERFASLLVECGEDAAWMVTADREVWRTASQVARVDIAVGDVIHLNPLSVDDLTAAVLTRHRMSGYELQFDATEDVGWQLWHLALRGIEGDARQQQAWFQTLHEASGGVLHDGLRLWLASIREVDEDHGVIHLGVVPRPPVARLFALEDAILLTLLQVLRQGWIDADQHASMFRGTVSDSQVHLVSLAHRGLLMARPDGRFEVTRHLRNPVQRALLSRGWV